MFSTASVVPKLCAAWSGIWFSAGKRVFFIFSTLFRWTLCPPSMLLSGYCGCFLGGIWLGHRRANLPRLMLRLRNYTSHPTVCCHVTTLSSLSLQFFMLVSGRIPQLHILTNLYQMTLLKWLLLLLLSKVIKKNCVGAVVV
jgi:hypothetical protein